MSETPAGSRQGPWRFFVLTTAFTWLFWVPDALGKRGVLPDAWWTNLGFVGALGPLVVALFLVHRENGTRGVRDLLKKGVDYRFGVTWWAVSLLFFPVLVGGAYAAGVAVDGAVPPSEAHGMVRYLPFVFLSVMFTSGPFQEEFGWRGYALPRLLDRYTPLVSSVVLGSVWALWHGPQFLVPPARTGMFYVTPFWSFALTVVAASIAFTWVAAHTNGSVLAAILLHTQLNLSLWLLPVLHTTTGYLWVLGMFLLAAATILILDRTYFLRTPHAV